MMKLGLFSISCFFCYIFVSSFLLNTLFSLPLPRPDQVELLLAFKNEFSSTICDVPSPVTKSWAKDAINFDGVVFDNETGVVTKLNIPYTCLSGTLKANSSLFRFQHLRSLDLSYNHFSSSQFLTEFGQLTNLECLDLSYNGLVGEVPSSISNLTRLTYLDLSDNELTGSFPFIHNLTKLSFIDLSTNHFFGTIPYSLFTMPFLSYLDLRQNHLKNPLETMNRTSTTSSKLKDLLLGKNLFNGGILKPISKLVSLTRLDLSFNEFFPSPIPSEFGKLTNLEILDLQSSGFTGEIPSSISNLSHLTYLKLSNNNFTGSITFVPNLTKLSTLYLSSNNFFGPIPSSLLTTSSSLSYLYLSGNHLSDPIQSMNSSSSSPSSKLQELHLSGNLFSGQILESILKLVNLKFLDLSFSHITYPKNFSFLPLKSLQILDMTGSSLSWLSSASVDVFSTELTRLHLSDCNINEFPKFIKKQRSLWWLDIAHNNIKGKVPEWLWNLPLLTHVKLSYNLLDSLEGSQEALLNSSIQRLELDSNAFQGSFPILPPKMVYVSAAKNKFTGNIPLSLCSTQLFVLDLSDNNFTGSIPGCFGETLGVLNLHNNSLSGTISDSFTRRYPKLTTIDVGHNQITGKLPRSLVNCTSLTILNVEGNGIIDTFPFWLKSLPNLQVMFLGSNRFHGPISSPQDHLSFQKLQMIDISGNSFNGTLPTDYFMNWSAALVNRPEVYRLPEYITNSYEALYQPSIYLRVKGVNMEFKKIPATYTVIDFSGNRFGGHIPESIGLLKHLVVLDLSKNGFFGHIPSSLAKLTKLESLDLSQNQLSGLIPQEIGSLSSLAFINMSHNKLIGDIPQGTQFGTQPKSSFEGNVDLCGLPLQESCLRGNVAPSPERQQLNQPKEDQLLNWKAAAIGYGPGVLFGLAIGHVMASYRPGLYYKLFRL